MPGTVGIAIPAYGRGRHLGATLQSALDQTRPADQIVVIDDCSPDETAEVARSFASRGVKYVRNEKNVGVPGNYNVAVSSLTTDYVMILEDHDLLKPTFIEDCARVLDENASVNVVATAITEIDEVTGAPIRDFISNFPAVKPGRELAEYVVSQTTCPFGLCALIRRSALEGLEPWFDPKYWWYADLHLWIRLGLKGDFGYVAKPLLAMRQREETHFLSDRAFQSIVCCDRIRGDNWNQVFPEGGMRATALRAAYCASRDLDVLKVALHSAARGNRVIPDDVRAMVTPFGRAALEVAGRVPLRLAQALRAVRHRVTMRA